MKRTLPSPDYGPLAPLLALLFLTAQLPAVTYFWDNNGETAGFGDASGAWAWPTTNGPAQGWSTNSLGTTALSNTTTTSTADPLVFGTSTDGLGAGTVTISGTVLAAALLFGKASGPITLEGGTVGFATSGADNIWAYGGLNSGGVASSTMTINSDITKASSYLRFGTQNTTNENYIVNGVISGGIAITARIANTNSFLALNGLNTFGGTGVLNGHYSGQVNINTLSNAGAAQSLGTNGIWNMGGSGGQSPVLLYTGTNAASSDMEFQVRFTGAGGVVAKEGAVNLTGLISNANTTLPFYAYNLSGTAANGTNEVSGAIAGTLNVSARILDLVDTANEDGWWKLSGSNSYTGTTTVQNASTLVVANDWALGATAMGTTVTNTGSLQFEGGVSVAEDITNSSTAAGALRNLSGSNTLNGSLSFNAATNDISVDGGQLTVSGSMLGSGALVKSGTGTLTLSGNNTYSGATTVSAGTLVVDGTNSASATTVQSGAMLAGSGALSSATVEDGGTISPGNSPGTFTLTNGLTWNAGGNYNWQIYDAAGTAGGANGWDLIAVTGGTWDITGLSSGNPFDINLWSLSGISPDANGDAINFDNTQNYTWEILTYTSLNGTFSTDLFNINTAANNGTGGFANALGGGTFSLAVDGDSLNLLFTAGAPQPVPEPGTWAVAAMLAGAAGCRIWRRRMAPRQ